MNLKYLYAFLLAAVLLVCSAQAQQQVVVECYRQDIVSGPGQNATAQAWYSLWQPLFSCSTTESTAMTGSAQAFGSQVTTWHMRVTAAGAYSHMRLYFRVTETVAAQIWIGVSPSIAGSLGTALVGAHAGQTQDTASLVGPGAYHRHRSLSSLMMIDVDLWPNGLGSSSGFFDFSSKELSISLRAEQRRALTMISRVNASWSANMIGAEGS